MSGGGDGDKAGIQILGALYAMAGGSLPPVCPQGPGEFGLPGSSILLTGVLKKAGLAPPNQMKTHLWRPWFVPETILSTVHTWAPFSGTARSQVWARAWGTVEQLGLAPPLLSDQAVCWSQSSTAWPSDSYKACRAHAEGSFIRPRGEY